jgi:hypothetical protein
MMVADDAFGSLWMVPMIDVLNDIKQELNAAEVRLITYSESLSILQSEDGELDTLTNYFAPAVDFGAALNQHDDSSSIANMQNAAGSALSVSLGPSTNTQNIEPEHHPLDTVFLPTFGTLSPRGIQALANQSGAAPIKDSQPHSIKKIVAELVWFCSNCGDGPQAEWRDKCSSCDHLRGIEDPTEDTM